MADFTPVLATKSLKSATVPNERFGVQPWDANTSLMLTRLTGERSGCLACRVVRE